MRSLDTRTTLQPPGLRKIKYRKRLGRGQLLRTQEHCIRALGYLGSESVGAAEDAFAVLWEAVQYPLRRLLRGRGVPAESVEDLLQQTASRLWASRRKLAVPGPGAWWCLVRRVALNLAIDESRKTGYEIGIESPEDIPDDDLPYLDIFAILAAEKEDIFRLANQIWLGGMQGSTEPEVNLRVAASQLYYMSGMTVAEIRKTLSIACEAELEGWLKDPRVLARMCCHELYYDNDALTAHLIWPQYPCGSSELNALNRSAREKAGSPPDGWTWELLLVLFWRIRNGMLVEQIERLEQCPFNKQELRAMFSEWQAKYPFRLIAEKLRQALRSSELDGCLQESGLWRRLVFQYDLVDDLAYRQILERTVPAAEVVNVKMTEARLTGWIGMGRLWAQIAAEVERERDRWTEPQVEFHS